jgi:hypothetical protein
MRCSPTASRPTPASYRASGEQVQFGLVILDENRRERGLETTAGLVNSTSRLG